MSEKYKVRGPSNSVPNGEQFSQKTASIDLDATDWAPSADSADVTDYLCPRAFVPAADGTLAITALDDSAVSNLYVKAGVIYPIAIKAIDQSACSAALQIADAVTLLY